ncbi:MAG TPA: hypothetical protein VKA00_07110 [Trueperaceae bacterium]|nr:hypothetical protein [Trueperaceae bacterium]
MDERLRRHTPSVAARRRAEAEGIDLEAMKRDAPHEYMILNAAEALRASPELAELAGSMLLAAFPEREVFRAPAGARERLLAFPPLAAAELTRFDALLAPLVERPEWRERHAYFREVTDARGRTRELALAVPPSAYQGGDEVVGPFGTREAADAWGRERIASPRVHDAFPMNGAWFCDVFSGDQA